MVVKSHDTRKGKQPMTAATTTEPPAKPSKRPETQKATQTQRPADNNFYTEAAKRHREAVKEIDDTSRHLEQMRKQGKAYSIM